MISKKTSYQQVASFGPFHTQDVIIVIFLVIFLINILNWSAHFRWLGVIIHIAILLKKKLFQRVNDDNINDHLETVIYEPNGLKLPVVRGQRWAFDVSKNKNTVNPPTDVTREYHPCGFEL